MRRPVHDVVVVGAGAAGLTVAEALRDGGFAGEIHLVGDEAHLPYDRPPLSKQVLLGTTAPERLALRPPDEYADLQLDLRLGRRATGLDLAARELRLDDGSRLAVDGLVVATGVQARSLAGVAPGADVAYLRTLDDALALRDRLATAGSTVVVGAGFLGVEIASAARRLGSQVTVVEPAPLPMLRQLGPVLGGLVRELHEAEGTRFRLGVGVTAVVPAGAATRVELDDGSHLVADVVVAAVGSVADTRWLAGSGLQVGDGVVCDASCRAADGVYAAGDIAAWTDPATGRPRRFEHRLNASEQARCVAANLLGDDRPLDPGHYFWSDQAGVRIQAVGTFPEHGRLEVVAGAVEERKFVAVVTDRTDADSDSGSVVTGVVAWAAAREFGRWRGRLGTPAADVRAVPA